jgi:hypothetical protein
MICPPVAVRRDESTVDHAEPVNPSNFVVVALNLNIPATEFAGRNAVTPVGANNAPVPLRFPASRAVALTAPEASVDAVTVPGLGVTN